MGWLYTDKPKNVIEYLKSKWPTEHYEVKGAAAVGFGTIYMAILEKESGLVFGMVYLVRYTRADAYNFGYKDICESMGPCETQCPESILRLLSPIEDFEERYGRSYQYAREWRLECQRNADRKKSSRRLRDGCIITFAEPYRFSAQYGEHATFLYRKTGRKVQLYAARMVDGGWRSLFPVKLLGWQRREYTVA